MIRVKCPKCAFSLAFEDDEAGQASECEECGARFRVPQPKAGAKSKADDERGRRPPPKRRDDEGDEDEDDFGDEEEGQVPRRKMSKPKGMSLQTKMNIQVGIAFFFCIIGLVVAEIFIPKLGMMIGIASQAFFLLCSFFIARSAWSESPLMGLLVFFCGPVFLFYCIKNWGRTNRLCVVGISLYVLSVASYFGADLNEIRVETRRNMIRESLGIPIPIPIQKKS